MISFAQNFEDVILARLFRDRINGFYVDVGAHYPLIDSVTEHFYRLGWRGINVEPLPHAFDELVKTRPFDINLNLAVAESEGELPFFALDGFSTLNEEVASRHSRTGLDSNKIIVPTQRLDAIFSAHSPAQIDFLKIDVEGAEEGVVRSNDWNRFRPAIVLIEMIDPQTQQVRFEDWEKVIIDARYKVVHFDGVNRWYWNSDCPSPDPNCFLPPNALDQFTTFSQISAEARAAVSARESAFERENFTKVMTKVASGLAALAQGDASTPAPHASLSEIWEMLRKISNEHNRFSAEMNDQNLRYRIEYLNHQIENLQKLSDDLKARLVFSERARLELAELLASQGKPSTRSES